MTHSPITINIQDMTRHLSHYTNIGHDTPPHHSIQTQAWHTAPSQYTDRTRHPTCHIIQTQDMTPTPITVYRYRTQHPTLSQYTDTGHDTPPSHSLDTGHTSLSQYTDTGQDTPPCHSLQTQEMISHLVIFYRHRTWHPSQYTYTEHGTPARHII